MIVVPIEHVDVPEEEEEEEEEGEEDVFEPPVFKRRRLRFVVANPNEKSRGPAPTNPPILPNYFLILLKEGEQNDYVADWGRCCIAGTAGSNESPLMLTKTRCHLDLRNVVFNADPARSPAPKCGDGRSN